MLDLIEFTFEAIDSRLNRLSALQAFLEKGIEKPLIRKRHCVFGSGTNVMLAAEQPEYQADNSPKTVSAVDSGYRLNPHFPSA